MKQPFGTAIGFDPSWVVQEQVTAGDREAKYTVDRFGIEVLRYPDSLGPKLRRRDRATRRLSRVLAMLPGSTGAGLVRRADRAVDLAESFNDRSLRWLARRPHLARQGLVPVGSALNPRLAAQVSDHGAENASRRSVELVLEAFDSAGIGAVMVPAGPGKQQSLALRGRDVDAAMTALTASLDRSWHVLPLDTPHARPLRMTHRTLRRLGTADGGFRLFRLIAADAGKPISGTDVGIDVEVWRDPLLRVDDRATTSGTTSVPSAETDSRFAATRRQVWTDRLSADAWAEASSRDGAQLPVSPLPHLFDVTGPIDVVYTWVDGADPAWNEARAAALGSPREVTLQAAATHAARFRCHDELRYSLRSLEMYAPWVRTVHIVTAGQVPYWLNTAHPRINLVDHREIFDPRDLPVFNSHAIEARLHRIPGLAERYLYLNDDVFFGRPVAPELFFHGNGLAKFFPSSALIDHGPREPHDDPVTSAAKNNRQLIAGVFGRTTTTIFQHTPHPQLRSVLEEMERTHPEVFARVAASKFRHPDDLSVTSALHHYYAYALGRAVPGRLEYLYLDLGHPRAASRLRRALRSRDLDVLCLNDSPDVGDDDDRSGRLLGSFLPRYYPLASSFELTTRRPVRVPDEARPRPVQPVHAPAPAWTAPAAG